MSFGLPKSLNVNGRVHPIRYQYTAILDIIQALNDPELEEKEKVFCLLYIMYEDFDEIQEEDYEEAYKEAVKFMDNGVEEKGGGNAKLIDFEQDAPILFPAINRVAGKEIRDEDDIHWWTFLGWFMEMGECTYSHVLNIRSKRAKGKKLEKWEQDFLSENKKMCEIQPKLSEEEKELLDELNRLMK